MRVVIIGAGMAGLTAAAILARAGVQVVLCEAGTAPGGKLHELVVAGERIDAGPTVFTMRPVFERIFALAGAKLEDCVTLQRLDCLARHFWENAASLDLHDDMPSNIESIGQFAGASAGQGYGAFARRAQKIFEILDDSFMQAPQPGLLGLARNAGPALAGISPFGSLWEGLGKFFENPKLRQLFARYATYCGSSPFAAPATLMLIAHAELLGVWRVEGGMIRLGEALASLVTKNGAAIRYGVKAVEIVARDGRVAGVRLAGGETLPADALIAAVDPAALDAGLLGVAAKAAVAGMMRGAKPSLSALTWAMTGSSDGAALEHHNVFFSNDYKQEFKTLGQGEMPADPTIYVCAPKPGVFFVLVNVPAGLAVQAADYLPLVLRKLARCGLHLHPADSVATGPGDWAAKFPATGGALYGRALTGWRDPFARPGAKTRLAGLYIAGGGVHPGPGLPMAATSGRLAAQCVLRDAV